jgi:hypothetical protein
VRGAWRETNVIHRRQLQRLLEDRVQQAQQLNPRGTLAENYWAGRRRAVRELWEDVLGITDDADGRPAFKPARARPEEFSIQELAKAFFTESMYESIFNPIGGLDRQTMLETGPGLDPTAQLNINLFSLATAGLIYAKMLERFQNPEFFAEKVMKVEPSRKNGEKFVGAASIGDQAVTRFPGQEHAEAGFGQRWVTTQPTQEQGLKCLLLQETVFFDYTGQVLDEAGLVGHWLGYKREKDVAACVSGVSTAPQFIYKDTTYNTYQTATPWINQQSNVLADPYSLDQSLSLARRMKDPETNIEILVSPDTIVCHPDNEINVRRVLMSFETREITGPSGTDSGSTTGGTLTLAPNPLLKRNYRVFSSMIWANQAWTAATGLSLTDANAKKLWFHLETGTDPAFVWIENWPLRVRQANATEYMLMDRGIIAAYLGDYRGISAVKEARKTIKNTN